MFPVQTLAAGETPRIGEVGDRHRGSLSLYRPVACRFEEPLGNTVMARVGRHLDPARKNHQHRSRKQEQDGGDRDDETQEKLVHAVGSTIPETPSPREAADIRSR